MLTLILFCFQKGEVCPFVFTHTRICTCTQKCSFSHTTYSYICSLCVTISVSCWPGCCACGCGQTEQTEMYHSSCWLFCRLNGCIYEILPFCSQTFYCTHLQYKSSSQVMLRLSAEHYIMLSTIIWCVFVQTDQVERDSVVYIDSYFFIHCDRKAPMKENVLLT